MITSVLKKITCLVGAFFISCTTYISDRDVKFSATNAHGNTSVMIYDQEVGVHKRLRDAGKICGHLNANMTWLVVEDGCEGDSLPAITAYRLTGDTLRLSTAFEQIKTRHYSLYSQGKGLPEPVFLGFDAKGLPKFSSANGIHTLSE